MFSGVDMCCIDPAQHLRAAGEGLDDQDDLAVDDLSGMSNVWRYYCIDMI